MKKKTVYFMRHAQSQTNYAQNIIKSLYSGDFETFKDQLLIWLSILPYNLDTNITNVGNCQVEYLSNVLKYNNFWKSVDYVILSTMKRARQTWSILRPTAFESNYKIKSVENELMVEAHLIEHFIFTTLDVRVQEFVSQLRQMEYERILLIGHGIFLRVCLE